MQRPSQTNMNNTVGSREEAVRQASELRQRQRRSMGQAVSNPTVRGTSRVRYGDDEVRGRGQSNNDYMRASSSTSNVVIPAKAPTVPPPPTHRIPPLEVQRAREEARRILQARLRQEDELESESTDLGEYTIRDGSHPSSGDYTRPTRLLRIPCRRAHLRLLRYKKCAVGALPAADCCLGVTGKGSRRNPRPVDCGKRSQPDAIRNGCVACPPPWIWDRNMLWLDLPLCRERMFQVGK